MKRPRFSGWQTRLRRVLVAVPLVALSVNVYFLARMALLATLPSDPGSFLMMGFVGFCIILGVTACFYILWGASEKRLYWGSVFASAALGMIAGAALYRWPLENWLLSQSAIASALDRSWRLIALGMMDGVLAGAATGFLVSSLDEGATHLTFGGVLRYVCVSSFVLAAGIVIYGFNQSGEIGDMFSPFLALLLLGLIRLGVRWFDTKIMPNR